MFVPSVTQANMEFYPCPMGYCRCTHEGSISTSTCVYSYTHSDPNLQCNCDRKGIRIGQALLQLRTSGIKSPTFTN